MFLFQPAFAAVSLSETGESALVQNRRSRGLGMASIACKPLSCQGKFSTNLSSVRADPLGDHRNSTKAVCSCFWNSFRAKPTAVRHIMERVCPRYTFLNQRPMEILWRRFRIWCARSRHRRMLRRDDGAAFCVCPPVGSGENFATQGYQTRTCPKLCYRCGGTPDLLPERRGFRQSST